MSARITVGLVASAVLLAAGAIASPPGSGAEAWVLIGLLVVGVLLVVHLWALSKPEPVELGRVGYPGGDR